MFRARCNWFIQYKKATLLLLYKELKYAYLGWYVPPPTLSRRAHNEFLLLTESLKVAILWLLYQKLLLSKYFGHNYLL
jgi:hypothetical protein